MCLKFLPFLINPTCKEYVLALVVNEKEKKGRWNIFDAYLGEIEINF